MEKDLSADFAEHLDLLLTFHMDDDDVGQGRFDPPVSKVAMPINSPHVRIVTLDDRHQVRITVEAI